MSSGQEITLRRDLFDEMVDAIERQECQFFACPGPDRRPKDMMTCYRCRVLWKLRHSVAATAAVD